MEEDSSILFKMKKNFIIKENFINKEETLANILFARLVDADSINEIKYISADSDNSINILCHTGYYLDRVCYVLSLDMKHFVMYKRTCTVYAMGHSKPKYRVVISKENKHCHARNSWVSMVACYCINQLYKESIKVRTETLDIYENLVKHSGSQSVYLSGGHKFK